MLQLRRDREIQVDAGLVAGCGQLADLHLLEGGDAGKAAEGAGVRSFHVIDSRMVSRIDWPPDLNIVSAQSGMFKMSGSPGMIS